VWAFHYAAQRFAASRSAGLKNCVFFMIVKMYVKISNVSRNKQLSDALPVCLPAADKLLAGVS